MSSKTCKWCGFAIDGSRGQYTSLTYECGTYNVAADGGLRWTQSKVCSRLTQYQNEKRPSAEAVQAAVEAMTQAKSAMKAWMRECDWRVFVANLDNAIAGLTGGEG